MPTLTIFYGKIIDFSKCLTFFKFIFQLELHPLSLKLYKHQTVPRSQTNHVPTVVGGYSAAAIHASGGNFLKFIYSEKSTKFCKISTNYLTGST